MNFETLTVDLRKDVCTIQFNRPSNNNSISSSLINEVAECVALYEDKCKVLVFEGARDVFCTGADFQELYSNRSKPREENRDNEILYDLWKRLISCSCVVVSHVRGKANAGGMGFVAASDIVLADHTATFGLSELIFGLFPAMVLPFLIRKIGLQKAHYLTLMTKPVSVQEALSIGLVDAWQERSDLLVSQHLRRLTILPKSGIADYKEYITGLMGFIDEKKEEVVKANSKIFSDPRNLEKIYRFVEKGQMPWEDNT